MLPSSHRTVRSATLFQEKAVHILCCSAEHVQQDMHSRFSLVDRFEYLVDLTSAFVHPFFGSDPRLLDEDRALRQMCEALLVQREAVARMLERLEVCATRVRHALHLLVSAALIDARALSDVFRVRRVIVRDQ